MHQSKKLPITNEVTISDTVRNETVTNLTTNTITTVNTIYPNIQKFLNLYPHSSPKTTSYITLPSTQFSTQNITKDCNPNIEKTPFLGTQNAHEDFVTFRNDEKLSDKDSIFATFI